MEHNQKVQPVVADKEKVRSRVALKGFFNICLEWDCSREEMRKMLGGISESTLDNYKKLPEVRLPRDQMERISYVLGIYRSIREIYPTAERANRRMRLKDSAFPFSGCSAMDFMARGSLKHLIDTDRFFKAKLNFQ